MKIAPIHRVAQRALPEGRLGVVTVGFSETWPDDSECVRRRVCFRRGVESFLIRDHRSDDASIALLVTLSSVAALEEFPK